MSTSARNGARSLAPLPVRAHPLVLGVVLFLASELMFFAALFAGYFELRANRSAWPPPTVELKPWEAAYGTFLLFAASVVMVFATKAMDRGKTRAARCWTFCAVVAATGFVLEALHGYAGDTFGISTNAYGSIYYAMTGFHLLHVIVGIAILAALLIGMRSPALQVNQRAGAEAMTYYWHFVFIVWIGIFSTIYFVR
ncbi:MAG: heme-copper oxidase subunit III [Candidatus Eremiobacteraeota bacterium]|nr:heme-copper oxidase subunit III [Candidatus Eremiobacteraeota bacterium]